MMDVIDGRGSSGGRGSVPRPLLRSSAEAGPKLAATQPFDIFISLIYNPIVTEKACNVSGNQENTV